MAPALDRNGLTDECDAFKVTHDVGLGIFNWMASVPTVVLVHQITGGVPRDETTNPAQDKQVESPPQSEIETGRADAAGASPRRGRRLGPGSTASGATAASGPSAA